MDNSNLLKLGMNRIYEDIEIAAGNSRGNLHEAILFLKYKPVTKFLR